MCALKMVRPGSSPSSLLGNRFEIQPQAGKHRQKGVYLAKDIQRGDLCTVHKIKAASEKQASVYCQHIEKEAIALRNITNPQIETIRACFSKGISLLIVKDQTSGEPYSKITKEKGRFTEQEITSFLEQSLALLAVLHNAGITHRNLSPATIYRQTSDHAPALTQFGFLQDVLSATGLSQQPSLSKQAFELTGTAIPEGVCEDLHTLTLTAIILLTGQPLSELFNPTTQTWDWEDYLLATDDFSQTINRMLSSQRSDWFTTADDFLHSLSPSIPTEPSRVTRPSASFSSPVAPHVQSSTVSRARETQHIQKSSWLSVVGSNPRRLSLAGGGALLLMIGAVSIKLLNQTDTPASPLQATATDTNNNGTYNGVSQSTISTANRQPQETLTPQSFDSVQVLPETESDRNSTRNGQSRTSSSSSSQAAFQSADFPKSVCGDANPTRPYYRVYVSRTSLLNRIRTGYCQDAYIETNRVKVATFDTESKADAFKTFLRNELGAGVEIDVVN